MVETHALPSREVAAERARALRFVRRNHRMRTLGLALGAVCVASVLRLNAAAPGWWLVLVLHALLWPQLAMLLATRSSDPRRAENRSLLLDSALGGMWVAVMQFNLLPSVLLVTMLSADKIGSRHSSFLVINVALLAAACALTSAALGFPLRIETPMPVVIACVPFLIVYPLTISGMMNALAVRVTKQNRLLAEVGRTDGLTGLANRRQCFAVAKDELARHARSGRPAVLFVIDIDRFKEINDRYGHPVGDDVLCGIAAVLRECTRTIDTTARYGGDEFVIVMPETNLVGAEEVARRIRKRLAELTVSGAPDLHCTVSIGAAEAQRGMDDVELWVHEADRALYRAKDAGRDRFVGAIPQPGAGDPPQPASPSATPD